MTVDGSNEVLEVLKDIRELLVPISAAYRRDYEAQMADSVRSRIGSSAGRQRAWDLADGTRSQRAIAREAGISEGNLSKFFKELRALGAVSSDGNGNPLRTFTPTD